jgi:glycerate 2-kinase
MIENPRGFLLEMFRAAIDAALPAQCVPPYLPPAPRRRTIVIGAGKASAAMARVLEENWPAAVSLGGLVVTRYGHGAACDRIAIVQAGHPVPDEAGYSAALRMLDMVSNLSADDLVVALMSGGGSSLLVAPAPGVTLADKQGINRALLRSGASIGEMNCVRKHISAVKGGRLALAALPARTVTLIISDVPGDDPGVVASGPTVADATTRGEAAAILQRYRIAVPAAVSAWLADPSSETIKPGDPRLERNQAIVVATARQSLEAASLVAERHGVVPVFLGDSIEGEARDVARAQAALARSRAASGPRPCVLLSGGETTVTVRGSGSGGRNTEFLLALGLALDGAPGIHALAADTDGIDGSEDNAGALLTQDFLLRCERAGLDPAARLADNDAFRVFDALGDLVVTGPTLTNVNDFRAILIA